MTEEEENTGKLIQEIKPATPSSLDEDIDLEEVVVLVYKLLRAYNNFLKELIDAEESTKVSSSKIDDDLFSEDNIYKLIELGPEKIGHVFVFFLSMAKVSKKLPTIMKLTTEEKRALSEEINAILEQNKELLED